MKTLPDYLKSLPPCQIVRIGTRQGSGFIYIGEAGKCTMKHLDRAALRKLYISAKNQVDQKYRSQSKDGIRHDRVNTFRADANKIFREIYKKYIPMSQRKIIEIYDGLQEKHKCIIIEGNERGRDYNYKAPVEIDDQSAAENLAAAVYKSVCQELISLYMTLDASKDGRIKLKDIKSLKNEISNHEEILRANKYAILSNPEMIISMCKTEAKSGDKYKMDYNRMNQNVRDKIIKAGLTQAKVAHKLNMSQGTFSLFLRNQLSEQQKRMIDEAIEDLAYKGAYNG